MPSPEASRGSTLRRCLERLVDVGDAAPDLAWARSGAMALCGWPDSPPLLAPAPVAAVAEASFAALRELAGGHLPALDAAALLGERAAAFALERRGDVSPSGNCRLLRARDAVVALNLARDSDRALLPAWLESELEGDPWQAIAALIATRDAAELVERGRLLALPIARPGELCSNEPGCRVERVAAPAKPRRSAPIVLDLSSLWAGPLATHLLALAGARVIKVESVRRPDGARRGPAAFFDVLNAGKESVAIDHESDRDVARLRRLIAGVDMVVESARPRALAQLGIDARGEVARHDGLTWVSITGYGRDDPFGSWVAFGDDAAVAAGLLATSDDDSRPAFCGDAIADPLTGLQAAAVALAAHRDGGGVVVDAALARVAASTLHLPWPGERGRVVQRSDGSFCVEVGRTRAAVEAPRLRPASGPAAPLGAHSDRVFAEFDAC